MKKLTTAAVLLAALFCLAITANADVIYSNIYSVTNGTDPIGIPPGGTTPFGPLADSFSTGASGFNLGNVQLLLIGQGTTGGSISVGLFSDSSTQPGTLLSTIGTLNDSALMSSNYFNFALASPYTLAPNTRYWIELSTANNSGAYWAWSLDQTGIGVAGEYFNNSLGTFANANGAYQMALSGTTPVPTPAPEPATMLLLVPGLVGLIGFRRKSK